jgi:hypothetical protein
MSRGWIIVLTVAAALTPAALSQSRKGTRPWRNNVNLMGGDYRSIDMNTSDPSGCKAVCEREAQCKAWTFVKPDESGRAYCWLKDSVPEATREDCCVSALKGEGGSAGAPRAEGGFGASELRPSERAFERGSTGRARSPVDVK